MCSALGGATTRSDDDARLLHDWPHRSPALLVRVGWRLLAAMSRRWLILRGRALPGIGRRSAYVMIPCSCTSGSAGISSCTRPSLLRCTRVMQRCSWQCTGSMACMRALLRWRGTGQQRHSNWWPLRTHLDDRQHPLLPFEGQQLVPRDDEQRARDVDKHAAPAAHEHCVEQARRELRREVARERGEEPAGQEERHVDAVGVQVLAQRPRQRPHHRRRCLLHA